jgi:hypothetical protein
MNPAVEEGVHTADVGVGIVVYDSEAVDKIEVVIQDTICIAASSKRFLSKSKHHSQTRDDPKFRRGKAAVEGRERKEV